MGIQGVILRFALAFFSFNYLSIRDFRFGFRNNFLRPALSVVLLHCPRRLFCMAAFRLSVANIDENASK